MRHVQLLGIALCLAGCAMAGPSVAPALTASPTPAPTPLPSEPAVPPGESPHYTLTPARPCLGEKATLQLKNLKSEEGIATIWLRGSAPPRDWPDPTSPPYAVKLGEAILDEAGNGQLAFTLQPQMGPLTTGGTLSIEPDRHYELEIRAGNGGVSSGLAITPPGLHAAGSLTPCAMVSLPPATPRFVAIEPESVCPGENITITGTGFSGPTAIVTTQAINYFGSFRRTTFHSVLGEVAIDAQGGFSLLLALPTSGTAGNVAVYGPGMMYIVEVYDQYGTRLTRAERTLKVMDCR